MSSAIDGLGVTGGAPPSSNATQGNSNLGKDEFLKLLVAQLGNQDPLQPVDNQAFIAQLAQFSSVEQQAATNQHLEALVVAQAAGNQTSVASLVGKDALYKSDKMKLGATGGTSVLGDLHADAATVNCIISDSTGKVVRTVTLHDVKAGEVDLSWDGLDDSGNRVAAGEYSIKLTAGDDHGAVIPIDSRGRARIAGVSFTNGYPELLINGVRVRLSDVVEIAEPQTANQGMNQ